MKRVGVALVAVVALIAGCSSSDKKGSAPSVTTSPTTARAAPESPVAVPTVAGPMTGGDPDIAINAAPPPLLETYDYGEKEYSIEGTATSYMPEGVLGEDGAWNVEAAKAAPYKSRILVRTPNDPAKFNGTVIVEWFNVTVGRDSDPDFGFTAPLLMRDGFAWVGVSAQKTGVDEAGFKIPIPGYNPLPLTEQNPERYKSLHHPGDDYSYDIYSQAAQLVWRPGAINVMGGLVPAHVIADGESQSASRMVTYVNAIAPVTKLFDGFMIHSRGASGSPVNTNAAQPKVARIRTDLTTPVFQVETETDVDGFDAARQPDNDMLRTWDLAGTAHADQTTLDYGIESGLVWSPPGTPVPDFDEFCGKLNDGQQSALMRAAISALNAWVVNGTPPPNGDRFEMEGETIKRDEHGNALGGVRSPSVDAPTEQLDGTLAPGRSVICSLFGFAKPLSAATLKALYPTHDDYVAQVKTAADAAVAAGFMLQPDADEILATAEAARIPS